MSQYIIYFNQQWLGDHSEEWFASRGPLAKAVMDELRDAGVLIFAAGVDEDLVAAITADGTGVHAGVPHRTVCPIGAVHRWSDDHWF